MLTVASWTMNPRLVAWRRLRDLTRESGASIVLLQEARLTRVQTATARAGTSRPTHPSSATTGTPPSGSVRLMWLTWLTKPPALLAGLLTWIAAWKALRAVTGKVVLFPRSRAERLLGHHAALILRSMLTGEPSGLEQPAGSRQYAA